MLFKKSLLKRAYNLQEKVEQSRKILRENERRYEASKKELSSLIKEAKDNGILKQGNFILEQLAKKGRREIDKDAFLKAFGQRLFIEVANIKISAAEEVVAKSELESAEVVLSKTHYEDIVVRR